MVLVAVQLSVLGLYLPPVFKYGLTFSPPQTIISAAGPDCRVKELGHRARLAVLVAVQLSVLGLYLPPVFKYEAPPSPPQTIISAAGPDCRVISVGQSGALVVLVAVQLSVLGLYLPPVFKSPAPAPTPDDHFTAGPDCRVTLSASGRVGRAGGCPAIRAGIVSPAGVQTLPPSAPPQTIISLPVQTAV